MGWKSNTLVVLTISGLAIGAITAFEPKTNAELEQQRRQELYEQWSEVDEKTKEDRRREAGELLDAVNEDALRPGERRPPEPDIKIRIRP